MGKETWASIRPTEELIALYELIKQEEPAQDANRQAIFDRAMRYVSTLSDSDRSVLKVAALQKIEKIDADFKELTFLKVRVDAALFKEVSDIFRGEFLIGRVKTPFLMRVTLAAYLRHIRHENKETIFKEVKPFIEFGIDPLVFKQEYELSTVANKERLYEASRAYLENVDIELNTCLRASVNKWIQGISDYYNVSKYYPKREANFAKTTIVFISKVLAGVILFQCEVNGYDIAEVIQNLEKEVSQAQNTGR